MNFKNLIEATLHFSSPQNCTTYIAQLRWQNGKIACVFCGCDKIYTLKGKNKRYKCSKCGKHFSITKGTIMEKSQIPLQKWLVAIYILTSHKKGISSVQLANDIGVTQKSAWFMAHRIREAFKNKKRSSLKGIVELDETYMGRKYRSEYKGLPPELAAEMEKNRKDKGSSTKGAVVALKEREGDVVAKVFDRRTAQVIKNLVKQYVEKGTTLMTDEALLYRKVLKEYKRFSVNHGKGEWVRGNVHNNGVENFWSVMKRAIYGIYHQVSYKHLQRYCDEFVFRFNRRKVSNKIKFDASLSNINGRLTYKELTKNKKSSNFPSLNEARKRWLKENRGY